MDLNFYIRVTPVHNLPGDAVGRAESQRLASGLFCACFLSSSACLGGPGVCDTLAVIVHVAHLPTSKAKQQQFLSSSACLGGPGVCDTLAVIVHVAHSPTSKAKQQQN